LICALTLIVGVSDALEKAQERELAELKISDPETYLDRLERINEVRWLTELKQLDPDRYAEVFEARMREAKAEAEERRQAAQAKAEERRNGFHCLSAWDGSHRALKSNTEQRMRNPDSFEHIETRITPVSSDGTHKVIMRFHAENGFGGMTIGMAVATVDNSSCSASEIVVE